MNWFERLTGFREETPQQVRANLAVNDGTLTSRINGQTWKYGLLETPSLGELRRRALLAAAPTGRISVREIVADVQELHLTTMNEGALFQVASQFNLLEMATPNHTPEDGIGIYQHDFTQGPSCAIAAGAGTIYRNYFAVVNGQIGQSATNQIDCLSDLGKALGNSDNRLWEMKNGYVLASPTGLTKISNLLGSLRENEIDNLLQKLRIGVQWDTQVTLNACKHLVSQAYCSALPVAYMEHPPQLWANFALLVLTAAYEATLCAAIVNMSRTGCNKVFLTLLGGGAFGNRKSWIISALYRALRLYENFDLNIAIVSYDEPDPLVGKLVRAISNR